MLRTKSVPTCDSSSVSICAPSVAKVVLTGCAQNNTGRSNAERPGVGGTLDCRADRSALRRDVMQLLSHGEKTSFPADYVIAAVAFSGNEVLAVAPAGIVFTE